MTIFNWPKGLSEENEMLFATGALVTSAASLEFFFFVVLECLTGKEGKRHCEAVWLSHRSTRSRIEMVLAAAGLNQLEPDLLKEIEECAAHMRAISKLRNYYGHARLVDHDNGTQYEGFELASEKDVKTGADPIKTTSKPVDRSSLKELKEAVHRAERLYEQMLKTAHRLRDRTGASFIDLPPL